MPDCVFCRIAEETEPARIVHADRETVAFLPLEPAVEGHVLVIPRLHVRDAWELDEPTSLARRAPSGLSLTPCGRLSSRRG